MDNIGVNDNFFDVGGHSLNILRVHGKLKEMFQTGIPVVVLFRYPTIRSLAQFLNKKTREYTSDEEIDRSLSIMEEATQFFIGDQGDQ
jgi:acyl carrier protein